MTWEQIEQILGADVAGEIRAAAAATPMSPTVRERVAALLAAAPTPRVAVPDRDAA